MSTPTLRFSVVIPTTGSEAKLLPLLDGLARQAFPRSCFEIIVVFDGAAPSPAVAMRMESLGARAVRLEPRSGPPIARNRGAAVARGEFLVSADDDIVPEAGWLANADRRLAVEPHLDVLEGITKKPGVQPVRIRGDESLQYILCNLFVRRSLFEKIGGFQTGYYDARNGAFFREDADLGYSLELAGARIGRDESVVVEHPIEHPRFLDPLRWAKRYEMDALLRTRFPHRFRERIEVHFLGPFRIRRPIVRACFAYVAGFSGALICALTRQAQPAWLCFGLTGLAFLPVWAKWRFEVRRLPVFLLVPFVLVWSYLLGFTRLRSLGASRLEAAGTDGMRPLP
ncbi:MAG TPA: glycosyltransferase family A protein [Candidatus Limnocylindria bacterium]|nr:glycosyltransferase family A protein [Candidatus Limnocylindria bacterium]